MANLQKETKHLVKQAQQDSKLSGAFASVMILGAFILGCWLFVFILFMIRNGG